MPRLFTEERGRAVSMVAAGCSFREVSKKVNNLTIVGYIGSSMMQHAYLTKTMCAFGLERLVCGQDGHLLVLY